MVQAAYRLDMARPWVFNISLFVCSWVFAFLKPIVYQPCLLVFDMNGSFHLYLFSYSIHFYGFYNLDKSGIFTTDNLYGNVKKEDVLYHIPYIIFKNTDNSNFKIKKISLNGVDAYQQNVVIEKNKVFYINRLIVLNTYPEILIYTEDVLKKEHTFKVVFRNASEDKKIFENTSKTRKKTIKYTTLHVLNIEEVEND